MDNQQREDALKRIATLSGQERRTLQLICQGCDYKTIARELKVTISAIKQYMGRVYVKFGFIEEMPRTERLKVIFEVFWPLMQELEKKQEVVEAESVKTLPESVSREVVTGEEVIETPDDIPPSVQKMVEEDEYGLVHMKPAPLVAQPPPPIINGRRTRWLGWLIGGVVLGTCLGAGVVYMVLRSGNGPIPFIPQLTPPAIPFDISGTPPTSKILTQSPVVIVVTATLLPSGTILPTDTATFEPTPIPKTYYDQGEMVTLKDGIYMSLSDEFLTEGGPCGKPDPGFGVKIVVQNQIDEQFLVRFNTGNFHSRDNLGNEYKLVAIGNNGDGFCNQPIGVPSEYTMSWGYWTSYIPMQFKGQVPLEATYILITADWISGVGPIVFRKDL